MPARRAIAERMRRHRANIVARDSVDDCIQRLMQTAENCRRTRSRETEAQGVQRRTNQQ